jgi:hypothetical protein
MLLGAVTWGPVCAGASLAADWLQPQRLVKAFLASQGLLDEAAATNGTRQQQRQREREQHQPGEKPWRRQQEQAQAQAQQQQQQRQGEAAETRGWWGWVRGQQQPQQQQRQQEKPGPFASLDDPEELELEFDQLSKRRQVGRWSLVVRRVKVEGERSVPFEGYTRGSRKSTCDAAVGFLDQCFDCVDQPSAPHQLDSTSTHPPEPADRGAQAARDRGTERADGEGSG